MSTKTIAFQMSEEEMELLKRVIIFEPFLQDNIRRASKRSGGYKIRFDAFDLFDAISALEYAGECGIKGMNQPVTLDLINKMKIYLNLIKEPGQQLGT